MVKRDSGFSSSDTARLVGRLIDAVHLPSRLTNIELAGLLDSFNELLTVSPEVHGLDTRVFGFHQALIVEYERRSDMGFELSGEIPGQLEFGDIAPAVFNGVEVGY